MSNGVMTREWRTEMYVKVMVVAYFKAELRNSLGKNSTMKILRQASRCRGIKHE
jgi:hypothetical protein